MAKPKKRRPRRKPMDFSKNYPSWSYPSARAFRAAKRRDAKHAERAIWKLPGGAGFTPMRNVGVLLAQVREYRKQLSVKNWGR